MTARSRRGCTRSAVLAGILAGLAPVCSCGASRASDPASRLVAVHNVMRALGLTELGAVSQGWLAEGQQARLPMPLPAACATLVAFGGSGTRQLEIELLGPDGSSVARSTARDAEAVLRACVERPGEYVAVVKMVSGAGDYIASSWTGGDEIRGADAATTALGSGGTCEAPTILLPGRTYLGTTEDAADENRGSCGNAEGRERVYRLDIASRQRVSLDVSAQFDSVLYVRKGDCSDEDAEVACNDDAPGGVKRSRIHAVLDPGTYYVIVDSYGDESGTYRLQVSAQDAPSLQDICRGARPLAAQMTATGNVTDAFDNVHATCGGGARGADVPYRFDLPARARIRFIERSTDFHPVVHVRRACEDDVTEVGCADRGLGNNEATWTGVLDPGSYWVHADGADESERGTFWLSAEVAPSAGIAGRGGTVGDGCGDAISLPGEGGRVDGDTFLARDDVAVSCGRPGSPDVVYRFDLRHRSGVSARLQAEEGSHVLALDRSCGDRSTEVSCGTTLEQVVEPGTYFLVVDAKSPESMGRFSLSYRIRNLSMLEAACARVAQLALGRVETATTVGAGDRFTPSCATRSQAQASPDRIYRFAVARRASVRLTLETRGFRGVLSLRRSCADDASEIRCADQADDATPVQLQAVLDPGTYYVVVDGSGNRSEGAFKLKIEGVK